MEGKLTINVLYVDDEIRNLESFMATFRRDFNIFIALSASEAEVILQSRKDIHVLITDHRMPIKTGAELLAEAAKMYPNPTRIMLTAFAYDADIRESDKKGHIDTILEKPFDKDTVAAFIEEGYNLYFRNIAQQERILKLQNSDKNK